MYKASELRNKSREELLVLISELKGKLLALRFESATGQLKESHLPKSTKKDIALIFTILKEKEQGIFYSTTEKNKIVVESKEINKNIENSKKTTAIKEKEQKIKVKEIKEEKKEAL